MSRGAGILPWAIWVLAALFVVFNYIQQVVPNVIAAELIVAYRAKASVLGNIAAAYFYAYAVLQIPVGWVLDRWGTRRPLVLAIVVAGLATVGFAFTQGAGSALAARLVMGMGAAFSFIGCLKLVKEWFPPSQFSTLAGMTNTAAMIGAATGAPIAMLVHDFGWRGTLLWIGVAELVLAVLVFLIVRDGTGGKPAESSEPVAGGGIGPVLKSGQVWLNAIYATGISLVFVAFGGLWGGDFIQKAYNVGAEAAAGVGSLLFLGGIAGSLFFGWWSDFLGRRKLPMIVAGVAALVTMAGMLYLPGLPLVGFQAGLFAVGFFSSANIVSYAVASDLFPRLTGLSIGFLSTCYYAGSAASQPLVGVLLGSGSLSALTAGDYRYAFFPLVAGIAVSLVAALLMREPLHSGAK